MHDKLVAYLAGNSMQNMSLYILYLCLGHLNYANYLRLAKDLGIKVINKTASKCEAYILSKDKALNAISIMHRALYRA